MASTATGLHVGDLVQVNYCPYCPSQGFLGNNGNNILASYRVTTDDLALGGAALAVRQGGTQATPSIRHIEAQLSPFNVFVTFEPTSVDGQGRILLRAEPLSDKGRVRLASVPMVNFTLSGADQTQPIAMKYQKATKNYEGLVNNLPPNVQASIQITMTDRRKRIVSQTDKIEMSTIQPESRTRVYSADGRLSVVIPEGGLPAGERIAIGPTPIRPPTLPVGVVVVGGPFNVKTSTQTHLDVPGTLRFVLSRAVNAPGASGFDPSTFAVSHFNSSTGKWDDLGGGVFQPVVQVLSLHTQELGVFLLVARRATPQGEGIDVSNAMPTTAQLWPPNHKLVTVGIDGVTTSNGTPASIVITKISSDEASQGKGCEKNCPDAVIYGETAGLRAERSTQGNGRVYTMYFTATDHTGQSGSGQVKVCVPHDRGHGSDCIDDGPNFDATTCANASP